MTNGKLIPQLYSEWRADTIAYLRYAAAEMARNKADLLNGDTVQAVFEGWADAQGRGNKSGEILASPFLSRFEADMAVELGAGFSITSELLNIIDMYTELNALVVKKFFDPAEPTVANGGISVRDKYFHADGSLKAFDTAGQKTFIQTADFTDIVDLMSAHGI